MKSRKNEEKKEAPPKTRTHILWKKEDGVDWKGEEFLTAPMVAAILHSTPGSLAYWRFRGLGPPWFKLGRGKVLYPRGELEAYIAARLRGKKSAAA